VSKAGNAVKASEVVTEKPSITVRTIGLMVASVMVVPPVPEVKRTFPFESLRVLLNVLVIERQRVRPRTTRRKVDHPQRVAESQDKSTFGRP
jgi:hypothetical protein